MKRIRLFPPGNRDIIESRDDAGLRFYRPSDSTLEPDMARSATMLGNQKDRRLAEGDRREGASSVIEDRRTIGDRRELRFGVKLTTRGALSSVEEWLEGNCSGRWSAVLGDMGSDYQRKTLIVMFELQEDLEKFKLRNR